jgi:hypothetical protein
MEQDRSQEMKCIVRTVRLIADEYTNLGEKISSMVKKAKLKMENIEHATKLANPEDVISEIKYNLDGLTESTTSVLREHSAIITRLGEEKIRAELITEANIRQVQKLKEEAAFYKRWANPLKNSRHLAKTYSDKALTIIEKDENVMGALLIRGFASVGGYFIGAVASLLAPLFWAIATVLQKRSEEWSQKFLDISEKIYCMTITIKGMHSVLQSIGACLMEMDDTVERHGTNIRPTLKVHQIEMIQKTCEKLKRKFDEYEQIPMQLDSH